MSEYNKDTAKKKWAGNSFPVTGQITIENLEEKQVAYVRHIGTYETLAKEYANLVQTLLAHAEKQHFLVDGQNWVLAIYHDNPEFAEAGAGSAPVYVLRCQGTFGFRKTESLEV